MKTSADNQGTEATFMGHPKGLSTLFFTEMWERFSFYGMRALLILFMKAETVDGGLGYNAATSGAVYAMYTSMVYLMGMPGGWIADRFLGQRRSVFWGGVLIAAGQFTLVITNQVAFFAGLVLITLGTGLLKPNVSTIVGQLYSEDDIHRDSGFSIFYMGINIGAFLSPLICGAVGEGIDWHLGFGVAGLGMVIGLVQYVLGARHLGQAGLAPVPPKDEKEAAKNKRTLGIGIGAVVILSLLVWILSSLGVITPTPENVSNVLGIFLFVLIVVVFVILNTAGDFTKVERKRIIAVLVLFWASAFFWGAYEQAGSSFNLFANDFTDRHLGPWEIKASVIQAVPAAFVVGLSMFFAWFWVKLGKRQPSSPVKFSLGLIFLGLGFVVMIVAARLAQGGEKVAMTWLLVTYFLHVVGEMCLSPVGLSTVTKLAPQRIAGFMMGVWFLSAAAGNYMGGRVAGFYESIPLWQLFGLVAAVTVGGGLLLLALSGLIRRLMGGVK